MARYLPIEIDGQLVYIEVTVTPPITGSEQTSADSESVGNVLRQGLDHVETVITGLAGRIGRAFTVLGDAATPEEVEVEFAVSLNTQGNVIVAKISNEATFKVLVKYTPRARRPNTSASPKAE